MYTNKPELAVVTKLDQNDPLSLSLASQLLERGVYFNGIENQQFPHAIPDSITDYKALLIDEKMLMDVMSKRGKDFEKLENFARKGLVFSFGHPSINQITNLSQAAIYDSYTSDKVFGILAHTDLTLPHPFLLSISQKRANDEILCAYKKKLLERLTLRRVWSEFSLHDWRAAISLSKQAGHSDVFPVLVDSISNLCESLPKGAHHDQIAGFFATAWLYDQTGDIKPFNKMLKIVERMIKQRPRLQGVITGCGFEEDPLFSENDGKWTLAGTTVRRNVMWTESLHFLGPTTGAAIRVTQDRKYVLEAMKVIRYLMKYHQDENGLIFHCTRNQKPIGRKWSRGIAHTLYGMIYLLEELEDEYPSFRDEVLVFIKKIGQSLQKTQDEKTGLWRNVVDSKISRIESSGSTCFAYVFAKCVNENWLDKDDFEGMVNKAMVGLKTLYWNGGLCAMCRGTGTGDEAYYIARPQGWGIVPQFIMAVIEYDKLTKL